MKTTCDLDHANNCRSIVLPSLCYFWHDLFLPSFQDLATKCLEEEMVISPALPPAPNPMQFGGLWPEFLAIASRTFLCIFIIKSKCYFCHYWSPFCAWFRHNFAIFSFIIKFKCCILSKDSTAYFPRRNVAKFLDFPFRASNCHKQDIVQISDLLQLAKKMIIWGICHRATSYLWQTNKKVAELQSTFDGLDHWKGPTFALCKSLKAVTYFVVVHYNLLKSTEKQRGDGRPKMASLNPSTDWLTIKRALCSTLALVIKTWLLQQPHNSNSARARSVHVWDHARAAFVYHAPTHGSTSRFSL